MSRRAANPETLTSVEKAFSLLELLAAAGEPLPLASISERCRISKPSTVRLLRTLLELGYADRPSGSREYCLGPKLPLLTASRNEHTELKIALRPVLEALHQQFNETVNLGILVGGNVMYLDYVETTQPLRMIVLPGTSEEWHRTALGRAIVCELPISERETLMKQLRVGRGIDASAYQRLISSLADCSTNGFAEEEGESSEGAACIAVGLARAGFAKAALSIAVPLHRLSTDRKAEIAASLKSAVQRLAPARS